MITITEIEIKLFEFLRVYCGASKISFQWQDELREDLGLDSLDIVEIVLALEKEFSITITDEVYMEWKTISDAIRAIDKLCVAKNIPAVTPG